MKKLEARSSNVEGARTLVQLDVAEASLPALLEGIQVDRVWLEPAGIQAGTVTYALRADQRLGESRKQPGVVAIDLLTDLMNELGDALDGVDVPQRLRDLWDSLVERYEARTSARMQLSEHPGPAQQAQADARANPKTNPTGPTGEGQ